MQLWWQQFLLIFVKTNVIFCTIQFLIGRVFAIALWKSAPILRIVRVTAGLAESNGSLPPDLVPTSPAGWLPRTGISFGTLRSVIEYGLPLRFLHCCCTLFAVTSHARKVGGPSSRSWNCSLYRRRWMRRMNNAVIYWCVWEPLWRKQWPLIGDRWPICSAAAKTPTDRRLRTISTSPSICQIDDSQSKRREGWRGGRRSRIRIIWFF